MNQIGTAEVQSSMYQASTGSVRRRPRCRWCAGEELGWNALCGKMAAEAFSLTRRPCTSHGSIDVVVAGHAEQKPKCFTEVQLYTFAEELSQIGMHYSGMAG